MSSHRIAPSHRTCGIAAAASHAGYVRDRNEDAFEISVDRHRVVLVVCDGVSSTSGGNVAATIAASRACEALTAFVMERPDERGPRREDNRPAMRGAIRLAGSAVAEIPHQGPPSGAPACTIVAAMFDGTDLTIGSMGDSRAYWIGERDAVCLTSDDSRASERERSGEPPLPLTDPLAHAITKWIGSAAPDAEPEITSHRPDAYGLLVVCTDGFWRYVRTTRGLAALVRRFGARGPFEIARLLVDHALAEGGHDNVTVAVAAVTPGSAGRIS